LFKTYKHKLNMSQSSQYSPFCDTFTALAPSLSFIYSSPDVPLSQAALNQSLIQASRQGEHEILQELLKRGAQVDCKDDQGKTALLWAAFNGHAECVSTLVESGADVNMECNEQTPLLAATEFNHIQCVKLLLEKGAVIDPPNSTYMGTPVQEAILMNRIEILSMFLGKGAKVDSRDRFGCSPLHNAAKYGRVECAELLLSYGASSTCRDMEGKTPCDIALEKGHLHLATMLRQSDRKPTPALSRYGSSQDLYSAKSQDDIEPTQRVDHDDDDDVESSQKQNKNQQQNGTYLNITDVPTCSPPTPSCTPSSQNDDTHLLNVSHLSRTSSDLSNPHIPSSPFRGPPRVIRPNFEIDIKDLELLEEIGSGFFGKVYKAIWQGGTHVAAKHLHLPLVNNGGKIDDLTMRNFRLEMEMLTALRHPNVVLFLGACTQPPNLLLVTEYMPRGSLFNVLHGYKSGSHSKQGLALGFKARMKMALDVACGMNYLHKQTPEPILHRDLKSSNLLVTEDLRVKVSDFGLARVKDNRYRPINPLDISIQAPEVLRAPPPARMVYTEKSDIYSFGLLLWELYTVRVPFSDMDAQDVAMGVLTKKLRPTIPTTCPPQLSCLMERCWDDDPNNRPSFQDIVQELRIMNST
jgi:ankyrin repeat protein